MLDKIFNPTPSYYKWDRFWVGFVPALITPLIGVIVFYVWKFSGTPFIDYLHVISRSVVLSPLLSLGVVINLFIFFPFMQFEYFNAGRGVIGATIIYAIPIIITKFFL